VIQKVILVLRTIEYSSMTVHSILIFDRRGKTLFQKRYSQESKKEIEIGDVVGTEDEKLAEQRKLVFGMLFSLRELVGSLAPEGDQSALHTVRTGACTCHNYETLSGLRFAMYTNNDVMAGLNNTNSKQASADIPSVRTALKHVYSEIWVECVVRSPLYQPNELEAAGESKEGSGSAVGKFDIRSTSFENRLDAYITSMPWFR